MVARLRLTSLLIRSRKYDVLSHRLDYCNKVCDESQPEVRPQLVRDVVDAPKQLSS